MAQDIITVTSSKVVYGTPVQLLSGSAHTVYATASKYGLAADADLVRWGQVDVVGYSAGLESYKTSFITWPWYGYSATRFFVITPPADGFFQIRLWPSAQTVNKTVLFDLSVY